MRRILAALVAVLFAVGCHGQQPPSPPVTTCPTTYTVVNPPASTAAAASITGTTTTQTPGVGTWVYVVQAWGLPAGASVYQVSLPSNVVQVTTTAALPVVDLSWTAPGTTANYTSYTYILSRASCSIVGVPAAPALAPPTTVVGLTKGQDKTALALNVSPPTKLRATTSE